ncbi:MAG: NAD(P)/FAD-dependent oxidoreductase, partial [Epsilonproteobacteria bacterium]|nr:NAD(P)/FAD-dependent oxidoreductase [Campylobacterota bacterium]
MQSDTIIEEVLREIEKQESVLSRREAMKLLALSPLAAGVLGSASTTTSAKAASNAKGKIVIVGG